MGQTTFTGPVVSNGGFIDSSFTTAQRDAISNPQPGLLIYNTDTNTYEVYTGTAWDTAFGGGGGAAFPYGLISFSNTVDASSLGNFYSQPVLFTPSGSESVVVNDGAGYFTLVRGTLATPFDVGSVISTASSPSGVSLGSNLKNIGVFFSPSGTEITVLFGQTPTFGTTGRVTYAKWNLSNPFDATTAVFASSGTAFLGVGLTDAIATAACLNSDGTKLIVTIASYSNYETVIAEIPLNTPYNVATAGPSNNYLFTANLQAFGDYRIYGLAFNPAGTVAYMQASSSMGQPYIIEFKLNTPYSLQSESDGFVSFFAPNGTNPNFGNQNNYGLTLIGDSQKLVIGYFDNSSFVARYITATLAVLVVPDITSVSPSSGTIGTGITIEGTGFAGVNNVTVGGVGTPFSAMGSTMIFTSVPFGVATGVPLDVVVQNPVGLSTEVGAFTATAPSVTTYTEGVDYAPGGVIRTGMGSGTNIVIDAAYWYNGNFNNLLMRGSGTVFTVVQAGVSNSVNTYTNWSTIAANQYSISGAGNQYNAGGNQSSISFS